MASTGPRRDYGEGSIYYRESDRRFVGSFRMPDGSRKSVYSKIGGTKTEARQKLKEAQKQAEAGTLVPSNKQSVSEFLEYLLAVKKLAIKANTFAGYNTQIKTHILPALGRLQLQKVNTSQVQSFINRLIDHLEPGSIRLAFIVFNLAMKDAVKWKMLGTNPCKGVTLPRVEQKEMQVLDSEQAQLLLETATGTELEALITVALMTGMRRGELLGLKWSDVEPGCLRIQRTVIYVNGEGFKETSPKTSGSKRTITLAPLAVEALLRHRTRQAEMRWRTANWQDRDLVFPNKTGGYRSFQSLGRDFKAVLIKAGLPQIRFHDLRHTCATLLLKMGVQPKIVQEVLGHASIKITMDKYGHVLPGMQEDAMDRYHLLLSYKKRAI